MKSILVRHFRIFEVTSCTFLKITWKWYGAARRMMGYRRYAEKWCVYPWHRETIIKFPNKTDLLLPACDFRPAITKLVSSEWKAYWDNAVFNKLHDINPSLDVSPSLSLSNRHDQTVFLRCRIGHTKITHSYLLTNDNAPFYAACNKKFTVKHFLLECHDFSQARYRLHCVNSLK
jgi:hypothetical protein